MGAIFYFYCLTPNNKEQYNNLLEQKIDDYELKDWLEENTDIKDVSLSISYSSMGDLSDWLHEYSKGFYHPDEDIFFEINKTEESLKTFHELYWIKEKWIDLKDIDILWNKNNSLIILKQY